MSPLQSIVHRDGTERPWREGHHLHNYAADHGGYHSWEARLEGGRTTPGCLEVQHISPRRDACQGGATTLGEPSRDRDAFSKGDITVGKPDGYEGGPPGDGGECRTHDRDTPQSKGVHHPVLAQERSSSWRIQGADDGLCGSVLKGGEGRCGNPSRTGGPRLKFAGDEENFMRGKKEVVAGAQKFGISVTRGPCGVPYREDATGGQRRNGRVEYGASVRLQKSERGTEHLSFRGVDGRRA